MCVLHNLSYRLDAEVPTRYRQLEYNARNTYTEKSSTGCFSNKSDKMLVSGWALPSPQAQPPPPPPPPGPGLPTSLPTGACRPPGPARGPLTVSPSSPFALRFGVTGLSPLSGPVPDASGSPGFPRGRRGRAPEGRFTPRGRTVGPGPAPCPGDPTLPLWGRKQRGESPHSGRRAARFGQGLVTARGTGRFPSSDLTPGPRQGPRCFYLFIF